MAFINHGLGKTYYQAKGSKKAGSLPLIGLHGGPGGTHLSLYKLFDLSSDRKVVLFDQLGSGRSSAIEKKDMKIATFVEDLHRLLNELGIEEFHLLGSSWGTTLALEYALKKKPKGLRSITFQSPMFSASTWEKDAKKLIKAMPAETQKVINYCHEIGATDSKVYGEAVKAYYKRHVYRPNKRPEGLPQPVPNTHGNKVYSTMWGPSEFCATGTLKNYEKAESLKKLKVPVLFLFGQHDEVTEMTIKRFTRLTPNAEYSMIRGASHSVFNEKPKAALKTLSQFLSEVESE